MSSLQRQDFRNNLKVGTGAGDHIQHRGGSLHMGISTLRILGENALDDLCLWRAELPKANLCNRLGQQPVICGRPLSLGFAASG